MRAMKVVAAVACILVVIATPPGSWRAFGVEGFLLAFAIGLAGIPPRELARRWLGLFVLVGFLSLVAARRTRRGRAMASRSSSPAS